MPTTAAAQAEFASLTLLSSRLSQACCCAGSKLKQQSCCSANLVIARVIPQAFPGVRRAGLAGTKPHPGEHGCGGVGADGRRHAREATPPRPSTTDRCSTGSESAEKINAAHPLAERGLDITAEVPAKLSTQDVEAADVVITMGCGDTCPYSGKRYLDRPLDDPAGQTVDAVRPISDDIDRGAGRC